MAKSFDDLVLRTTTKATRDRAARRAHRLMSELLLSELRDLAGKSQHEVAAALGIRQPSLSKLEHQEDMQVGTLKRLIEALGGRLDLIARFPHATVRVRQFDDASPFARTRRKRKAA